MWPKYGLFCISWLSKYLKTPSWSLDALKIGASVDQHLLWSDRQCHWFLPLVSTRVISRCLTIVVHCGMVSPSCFHQDDFPTHSLTNASTVVMIPALINISIRLKTVGIVNQQQALTLKTNHPVKGLWLFSWSICYCLLVPKSIIPSSFGSSGISIMHWLL